MSNLLIIDGIEYDVPIIKLQRNANILDKYAERTEDGVLHREPIGTYYNYTLNIGVVHDKILYNRLWDVFSAPVTHHIVELPHDHVSFAAYISSVSDEVVRLENDGALYKGLTARFTAMIPARKP